MTLIDSHAHLADEGFDDDRESVLQRAAKAGVQTIVVIGHNFASNARVLELVNTAPERGNERSPSLYATVGFAPHDVGDADAKSLKATQQLLDHPRIVAVGEIGLDYHYDMPRGAQRQLFRRQVGWAVDRHLPVVIHSREAEREVIAILQDCIGEAASRAPMLAERPSGGGGARLCGVIHCFTETEWMATAALDLGFYISFSGILTFRNAADLRQIARRVPLDRTLIETDSPYLAPEPQRGRRNEPAFVVAVAATLAEIHQRPVEEIAEITTRNTLRLFGLGGQ